MRAFKLTEWQPSPGCLEILVEGELDLAVSAQLRRALTKAAAVAWRRVVVDLEECEFIDLSALEILIRARARAPEGQELSIVGAKGQVRRLFMLTATATQENRRTAHPPDRSTGAEGPKTSPAILEAAVRAQGKGGAPGNSAPLIRAASPRVES
jgi:anti-anti-sigma factor